MKTQKFKRTLSLFLAMLMCVTTLFGMGTTAFAAEETDEVYLISYPRDGDANYGGEWGHNSLSFMNGWSTATSRFTTIRAMGSYEGNICYCIEPGVPQQTGNTFTKKGEDFWDEYPSSYNSTISPDDITDMLYIETPYVETGIKAIDSVINPVVATEVFGSTANVYQIFTFWGKIIWFIGVFAFCLYSIRSYSRLKKKLQSAVLLRDNIYISQVISTPFALGLRNPKIYLPSNLADAQEYVIAHEQTHLARRDNLAKILGYVVLILHWFNPLVWLAFKLFVTDMEMSCDESVIRNSKEDIRKEYSRSLLELSIEKSTLGVPMAFAEGNPKERIKNVMKSNTKKIIGFAGLGAVILIVVIAICLIPNRPQYATAKDAITGIPAIATQSATYAAIKTADGNTTITDSEGFNQLLNFIEGIEVNTKEVKRGSWNDSEGNNKITFYRADNSMDSVISFTSDYSKIWIETNATLSFTYSVKDPAEVQKGLAAFLGNNS